MSSSSSSYPYEPFLDFDRFFDDAFNSRVGRAHNSDNNAGDNDRPSTSSNLALSAFKPRMDLHEDSEHNIVTVLLELPGVQREDIDVQVMNGRLTVTAENKLPSEFEESGYAVREMRYGHFQRTINLPPGVQAKDISAALDSGVLRITFPRGISGATTESQRVPVS